MPSFVVKNDPKTQPQNCGCFSCIFGLFFLDLFVFFPLFLLISCCFISSWNPLTAHQMRLQAPFFLKLFGHTRETPGKSRDIPPKSFFPWVSKDIPKFLAPHRSRGTPAPHPKISRPKSLALGSFFFPEQKQGGRMIQSSLGRCRFLCISSVP